MLLFWLTTIVQKKHLLEAVIRRRLSLENLTKFPRKFLQWISFFGKVTPFLANFTLFAPLLIKEREFSQQGKEVPCKRRSQSIYLIALVL